MAGRRGPKKGTPQAADGFKVPQLPAVKERASGARGQKNKLGGATCGAKKKGTTVLCQMPAGWGTNHYGIGKCKWHGGTTPTHVKSAVQQEMRILFGRPIEINPLDAIIKCISIRHGELTWLSEKMSKLAEREWTEDTLYGKQFHVYARERQAAMNDVVRYSQIAVSLGIAERYVKMAETYGEMLANLIRGILDDLVLTPEQRERAPAIVRARLIALDGGLAPQGERLGIPERTAA